MGMATPANNHKNSTPVTILATTRLSSFEVKLSTTVLKLKKKFFWVLASGCLFWN
jgi:hypothetical protein